MSEQTSSRSEVTSSRSEVTSSRSEVTSSRSEVTSAAGNTASPTTADREQARVLRAARKANRQQKAKTRSRERRVWGCQLFRVPCGGGYRIEKAGHLRSE